MVIPAQSLYKHLKPRDYAKVMASQNADETGLIMLILIML